MAAAIVDARRMSGEARRLLLFYQSILVVVVAIQTAMLATFGSSLVVYSVALLLGWAVAVLLIVVLGPLVPLDSRPTEEGP